MSLAVQSAATTAPARRSDDERRPDLRPVEAPARRRRPRLAYAIVAVVGAVLIAVAQMALSVMSTQSTFEIASLDAQKRELTLEAQTLYDEVAGLGSPQNLAAQASALGMVIDAAPSYLRLSDGAVVGGGQAAGDASTVDAGSRSAVGNAFLADTQASSAEDAADEAPSDEAVSGEEASGTQGEDAVEEEPVEPQLPPAITDGLPSPATH
ncbi:hypothetical protein N8K70_10665 [Microbacterium betulae]|uniref:Cell division protein FtsL n=1 Tax=Microbacterium betulae TaxID=2981139 RepID=A0AA97FE59_9MICO|nr:hypothetical protein [Microbacterium sp. AB]WOF21846.1 hypothetical protein N8K70_10665 [Microbacterium sp. AB]